MNIKIQTANEVKNSSRTSTLAHETRKKIMKVVSIVAVVIIAGVLAGCQREQENEPLGEAILSSFELEEYIIAGADFQQSLAVFTAALNKTDLSMLDSTYDADGRKVLYLPASVRFIEIEKKIQSFNEKRDALRKKFPQFTSFKSGISKEYFQHSIKNSVNVRTELLKLGINPSLPKLKSGNEVIFSTYDCSSLTGFLDSWINSAGYVEVIIIYYRDGGIEVIKVDGASVGETGKLTFQTQDGSTYYNYRLVWNVGHTHNFYYGASTPTYPEDYWNLPGTNRFIYYNGSYIYY